MFNIDEKPSDFIKGIGATSDEIIKEDIDMTQAIDKIWDELQNFSGNLPEERKVLDSNGYYLILSVSELRSKSFEELIDILPMTKVRGF